MAHILGVFKGGVMLALQILLPFAVIFPLAWIGILNLLAVAGGWSRLARVYRDDGTSGEVGLHYRRQSGAIGWVSYNGCLSIESCESGLRLGVSLPFRIAHPTLFIPWSELHQIRERQIMLRRFVVGDVGRPTVAHVRLPHEVWASRVVNAETR
jgi:hypothetical protein